MPALETPLDTVPHDLREHRVPALREILGVLTDRVERGDGWRLPVPSKFERTEERRSESTAQVEATWLVPSPEIVRPRLTLLRFESSVMDTRGQVEVELAKHLAERETVLSSGSAPCCGWREGVVFAGRPERVHWVRKGPNMDALDAVGISFNHPHQPAGFVLAAVYLAGGGEARRMSETLAVLSRSLCFEAERLMGRILGSLTPL